MKRKVVISILALILTMTTPSVFVLSVRPVHASGGIVLHPPFNGTYRVTAYFDHDEPSYSDGPDGYNWIYNGERVPASYPNKTGEPYPYDGHDGWDWSMTTGTDILAAAAGTVVVANEGNWGSGYGRTIVISHSNNYYTQYSHLDQLLVEVGDPVTAGQHIAESGATPPGTPAHLHFGVRHGGWDSKVYATDPFGWRGNGRDPLFDYNGKESSCLWAGVPGDDISCSDIIVEDDAPDQPYDTWMEYSTWFDSSDGNGYREHHTYSWDEPDSYAYWLPVIPAQGYYQVYAFVPPISSRTTHAEYLIHGIPEQTVYRDQSGAAPRWMSLGTFEFAAGYSLDTWVRLYDYTTEPQYSHWVAADAMKFTASIVYLPDVKNTGGWTSSIIIRNNSTSSAQAAINYYNASGARVSYQTTTVAGNGFKTKTPPAGFSGSAVVVASEDVSVIARSQRYDEITIYNAVRDGGGSQGWEQVGATLYVPVVKSNWYGRYSQIRVLNIGGASTDVTVRYYRYDNGEQQGDPSTLTLAPNAQGTFYASSRCPSGYHCSAVVTSSNGQSLAAVVREYASDDTAPTMHNAFSEASTTNYVPVVKNSYYGQTSGLAVNNTSNSSTYATVTYYDSTSSSTYSSGGWINPHGTKVFYDPDGLPDGFLGSAVVSAGHPIVSAMYEAGDGYYKATNTFLAGGRELFTPELNTTSGYGSGISIQNAGSSSAQVMVHYYHSDGTSAGTRGPYTIAVGKTQILSNWDGGVPSGLDGSAWIESTNGIPVAATVNYAGSGSGDVHATYSGCQP